MIADYALAYDGPPSPAMPWVLFLALVRRASRAQARLRLALFDEVSSAIGVQIGGDKGGAADRHSRELLAAAYPLAKKPAKFVIDPSAGEADGA